MPAPAGFTFATRRSGEVVIRHHGRIAATLRGRAAAGSLADAEAHATSDTDHLQERMARLAGDDERGNERRPTT